MLSGLSLVCCLSCPFCWCTKSHFLLRFVCDITLVELALSPNSLQSFQHMHEKRTCNIEKLGNGSGNEAKQLE